MNKNKLIVLMTIFLTIFSYNCIAENFQNPSSLFNEANQILKEDFFAAELIYKKIIEEYPESKYASFASDILFEKYQRSGFFDEIINLYEQIKKANIKIDQLSQYYVAESYVYHTNYTDAYIILKKIQIESLSDREEIQVTEIEKNYYYLLIKSSIQLQKYEDFFELEKEYTEKYSDDYGVYYFIASLYLKQGQREEAIDYCQLFSEKVLTMKQIPDNFMRETLVIQNTLMQLKRFDLAYTNLIQMKEQISFYPNLKEFYYFALGATAYQQGDYKIAIDSFEYIVKNSRNRQMVNYSEECLSEIKKQNIIQ